MFDDSVRTEYSVHLESFEGPLDLLLHLIKKNEVDIYDIPISAITRQYLEYIDLMKELNLDVAGEFLVMASTLIQIKSRMLLPVSAVEESVDEEEDPRAELVRRLLEYEKYRDAASSLVTQEILGRDTFARKFSSPDLAELSPQETPPEVQLFDLVEALKRVLATIPVETFHEVGADTTSIADRITEILALLEGSDGATFEELFVDITTREFVVATFLALLELCRLKMVRLIQGERFGTIWVVPAVSSEIEEEREEASNAPP